MRLDIATVLVQWSAGGLFGCWITTRRRVVGIGYGWLLRSIFVGVAFGGVAAGFAEGNAGAGAVLRNGAGLGMAGCALGALVVSAARRHAPLRGPRSFDPALDLLGPTVGAVAILAAADVVGNSYPLSAARLVAGALLLGFVTDAMLLGHWYLVQPGLSREPIKELVWLGALAWLFDVALLLTPSGMLKVLGGSIDDGYGGLIGAIWVVSVVTTIVLLFMTWRVLKEPYYSAVMAATGLLYLTILTAFGTDVLARALLAT